jgi:hypothetical protein
MGDAGGQNPRLAGAGAGEHQDRAVQRLDGEALLGVELVEIDARTITRRPFGDAAGARLVLDVVVRRRIAGTAGARLQRPCHAAWNTNLFTGTL